MGQDCWFAVSLVCHFTMHLSMCIHAISGRGPLVRSSIKAAEAAGRWLKVYAVEKNPSAVVHIQAMIDREGWTDKVRLSR